MTPGFLFTYMCLGHLMRHTFPMDIYEDFGDDFIDF